MYRWLRNLHLLAGLFAAAYLLMYAWSGVQMSYNRYFNLQPSPNQQTLQLPARLDGARAVARILIEQHGAKGELAQIQRGEGHISFRLNHPGSNYEARYNPETGQTALTTRTVGMLALLNRIHQAAGFWHEYWLLNVLGVFAGMVSVLLVPLAITGIYLWFKLHNERLIGAILLTVNLLYTIPLIIGMRLAV